MKYIRAVITTTLSIFAVCITNSTYAKSKEEVKCPSLDKIHQAASFIKRPGEMFNKPGYYAGTVDKVIHDGNTYWAIWVFDITASSLAEAVIKGQKFASEVSVMKSERPVYKGWFYACDYYIPSANTYLETWGDGLSSNA